ncbi:putative CHY-type Zn-finger protein [Salsuginibacillus halophilus]|uniref:Putative CHY-type Zn-finger protein n=1 Tax=Salsuginibacillus halophilus TaxID=517424 RepID=A0A2P8HCK4_9BACI|nr:CHY zinc finger protein [Salsuginibacillus halophilus]PSL43963.1 putative CHY-type Zn-finger protein [Salsuginibacillus halophilus]
MKINVDHTPVYGLDLDEKSRCQHYHTAVDIISNACACCDSFYACARCHQAVMNRPFQPFPASRRKEGCVMCGNCGYKMTKEVYQTANDQCPECDHPFNPNCKQHAKWYFS